MRRLWGMYELLKADGLDLDMTRGKPCDEQLMLSEPMLSMTDTHIDGLDCRNYGSLGGLPEMRELAARYLQTSPQNTLVLGNSSLWLMYSVLAEHILEGSIKKGDKFLCPSPGYDRHHETCVGLGIDMIRVPLKADGPDMTVVRELIKDPKVVGMWCMPKFSNPTGTVYSQEVAREIATMKPANKGFIVMWDNAYAVHDLGNRPLAVPNISKLAQEAKTANRFWIFGSFSKVTFASAGLAMLGTSPRNFQWYMKRLSIQTIGPDKLSQLRHLQFLKNMTGVRTLMRKHSRIIAPKFQAVHDVLEKHIGGKGVAVWNRPEGGYFISFDMISGSAKRTIALAGKAGLKLTPAGSAFPYGNDPDDRHIRIAPTFPPLADVKKAAQVLAVCAELAHRELHPQTMRR
ncbi:MAG: aminotransferase class I/II-fold pyridoxal phosphate-dependent enzyme [Candidatus Pacebacteria bacterium]|nr:aminotransferase class I/II-fold pyridoxal phosphate-dependent enzyme [Candidatus Paceibacterota bacterium]